MERKYYQKPDTKTVLLKIESLLEDTSWSGSHGSSRELRRAWKDED